MLKIKSTLRHVVTLPPTKYHQHTYYRTLDIVSQGFVTPTTAAETRARHLTDSKIPLLLFKPGGKKREILKQSCKDLCILF